MQGVMKRRKRHQLHFPETWGDERTAGDRTRPVDIYKQIPLPKVSWWRTTPPVENPTRYFARKATQYSKEMGDESVPLEHITAGNADCQEHS